MANRVTGEEVKEIISTVLTNDEVEPFITPANILINRYLVWLADAGIVCEEPDADTLKEMEKWLSAHFISIRDPLLISEKVGDADNTYAMNSSRRSMAIDSTAYGQQAIMLDPCGLLLSIVKKKAEMKAMGATYTDYE